MNGIRFTVGPRTDGSWYVRRDDEERDLAIMPTRSEAEAIGRELARNANAELVLGATMEAVRRRRSAAQEARRRAG